MTVQWYEVAASMTDFLAEGILTGPMIMLAWSLVRDDQSIGDIADNVALVLRDEIVDLVTVGVQIAQVDESAIRELLLLNKADQPAYLKWVVGSFCLATPGVTDDIQTHTRMRYSDFNELIDIVDDFNADVTSIEAVHNGMHAFAALKDDGHS